MYFDTFVKCNLFKEEYGVAVGGNLAVEKFIAHLPGLEYKPTSIWSFVAHQAVSDCVPVSVVPRTFTLGWVQFMCTPEQKFVVPMWGLEAWTY